jgi:3-oxoacyl-[acyl-carrier protein] reductase
MDLGIRGKAALVCGASKGLGKAVAEELCREGVRVVICARSAGDLENAARDLRERTGGEVHTVVADVSTREGCATAVSAALQALQQIDILVTNSGGPPPGAFEAHDAATWDATYHQLLVSAVELVRGVLPGMKQRRWGRIIAITSQAVKQPLDGLILSNSVRASVVGLMRSLANELGPFGITVNNVMPGYTRTERLEKLAAANPKFGDVLGEIPLRRLAEPHEFAAAVAFLASERAAYITGASIPVDGGWIKSLL